MGLQLQASLDFKDPKDLGDVKNVVLEERNLLGSRELCSRQLKQKFRVVQETILLGGHI